jgi:hypothetical protein
LPNTRRSLRLGLDRGNAERRQARDRRLAQRDVRGFDAEVRVEIVAAEDLETRAGVVAVGEAVDIGACETGAHTGVPLCRRTSRPAGGGSEENGSCEKLPGDHGAFLSVHFLERGEKLRR